MVASTVRVDLRAALVTMLTAFSAANPARLKRTFVTRPASTVTDLPFAYVDLGAETTPYDNSIRTRQYAPGFVVVDALSDNAEAVARMDGTVDLLIDYMTTYPPIGHLITGSSWSNLSVTETDVAEGTYAVRIAISDFQKPEGRN